MEKTRRNKLSIEFCKQDNVGFVPPGRSAGYNLHYLLRVNNPNKYYNHLIYKELQKVVIGTAFPCKDQYIHKYP